MATDVFQSTVMPIVGDAVYRLYEAEGPQSLYQVYSSGLPTIRSEDFSCFLAGTDSMGVKVPALSLEMCGI